MSFRKKSRWWFRLAVALVALLVLQQFWHWEVERIEVPPGEFLVRIHRWGNNLSEDEIIAPDPSYKGVILDVLPEGRHFLNPILWSYEVHDMLRVPPGKCVVQTRLYGTRIPPERLEAGEILAREGERGIVREVLGPGSYRINPYAYETELVNAVEVKLERVGVRVLKVGRDPRDVPKDPKRTCYVVPEGFRGVQQKPVPPGSYYVNPYVEMIVPVDVRSHRVQLSDIQFPSRDGFILKPQVLVEYAVLPDRAPEVLVRLADQGELHQQDATPEQQEMNEILQKVILPHIRGYARIEGSNFDAKDFIITVQSEGQQKAVGNREVLQRALLAKVKPKCLELGIDVRAVTLAELAPPDELAQPISDRETARVKQERNRTLLGQIRAEQELRAAEARKNQARATVEADTRLIQANTKANQRKEVELLKLQQELANAELKLQAARQQAEAVLTRGKAEARVIHVQNEADVAGLRKAVEGFRDADRFAQYHVVSRLGPALTEIFASDSSEFAKLIATYLANPAAAAAALASRPGTLHSDLQTPSRPTGETSSNEPNRNPEESP
jgi:hypothetical protein